MRWLYLRPVSGCINAGCAAGAAVATAGFGLLTFVLLLANSSRIVCGMSGSNRTPCCEQPRAVRRSDIMTEGSVTGHWLFPSKFIRLIDIWWDNGQITIANTIVVNYILHVVIKYINRVAVIEYITNDKLLVTITYFICVLTIISEHDQSQSFENNKNVFEPRPHPLSDGTQCSGCDIKPVKQ